MSTLRPAKHQQSLLQFPQLKIDPLGSVWEACQGPSKATSLLRRRALWASTLSGVLEALAAQHPAQHPAAPIPVLKQAAPAPPSPGSSSSSDFAGAASSGDDRARSGSADGVARMDAKTAARLAELEELKGQAVGAEDYDEAKRLKQAIDRLRALAEQLADLEDR